MGMNVCCKRTWEAEDKGMFTSKLSPLDLTPLAFWRLVGSPSYKCQTLCEFCYEWDANAKVRFAVQRSSSPTGHKPASGCWGSMSEQAPPDICQPNLLHNLPTY